MNKMTKSEKLIIAVVFAMFINIMVVIHNLKSTRHYVNVRCPKCYSTEVVLTYKDTEDVEHLLCLDCKFKFTMTEYSEEIERLSSEEDEEQSSDTEELLLDSLYKPELECPD